MISFDFLNTFSDGSGSLNSVFVYMESAER